MRVAVLGLLNLTSRSNLLVNSYNCFAVAGRSLLNSIFNLGLKDQDAEALSDLGHDLEVVIEQVSILLYCQLNASTGP